jgi:uncharacterized protein (DUF58 family)
MIEDILQRVSYIPLPLWWRTDQVHFGHHQSRQRGTGLEFDQLKEYHTGEGIQKINWAATARRGGTPLLVNTYYEEKESIVMLLVDESASMDFGSERVTKRTLTTEISASLVYSALVSRARVGLLGFTAQVESYFPPRRSPVYQRAIPEAILTDRGDRTPADLWVAVEGLETRVNAPALVFLLSDFLCEDTQQLSQALSRLCDHYDLIALVVTDPREMSLPDRNAWVMMRDLETGKVIRYRFSRKMRRRMVEQQRKRHQQLRTLFEALGIAHMRVAPHRDYGTDLTQLLWTHARRKTG